MQDVLDRCDPLAGAPTAGWSGKVLLPAGLLAVLIGPATVGLLTEPPGPLPLATTLVGLAALAVVFVRLAGRDLADAHDSPSRARSSRSQSPCDIDSLASSLTAVPRLELAGCAVLAAGLATRGTPWVPALALATLVIGLHLPPAPAGALVPALSGLAGVLGWVGSDDLTTAATMVLTAAILGGFGYLSQRNAHMSARLRASERRLADLAVAEERLRIARELHDLLGHSLSLIALKAELAGTLLPADPPPTSPALSRARREIGELETVARRSLGEVREAVTGYRQPTLAAELAIAQQSTTTAGIACRIDAPAGYQLPEPVDALLAWTVREGVTNLIRHSHATACTLRLHTDNDTAAMEITDNGVGPADTESDAEPGSGLAGLAERAGRLGGRLDASIAGDNDSRGFRLRVHAPLGSGL